MVLILIHLRRQSAALTEAIDSSKNELSQLRKMPPNTPQHPSILGGSSDGSGNGENSSLDQHKRLIDDFSHHIKELEDKRARGIPIISLVDNMVKLGSLYRGPQDAPLSHRIRNIPTAPVSNFNSNHSSNRQHSNSSREQLSKYQRAEVQVSCFY